MIFCATFSWRKTSGATRVFSGKMLLFIFALNETKCMLIFQKEHDFLPAKNFNGGGSLSQYAPQVTWPGTSLVQGGLCPGGRCPGVSVWGSLSSGALCGGLCPGDLCQRGGGLCPGGLCLDFSVQSGLCPGCFCPRGSLSGCLCLGGLSRGSLSRGSLSRGSL